MIPSPIPPRPASPIRIHPAPIAITSLLTIRTPLATPFPTTAATRRSTTTIRPPFPSPFHLAPSGVLHLPIPRRQPRRGTAQPAAQLVQEQARRGRPAEEIGQHDFCLARAVLEVDCFEDGDDVLEEELGVVVGAVWAGAAAVRGLVGLGW